MIMRERAALGGTQLDSLDTSIVIQSIDTGVPHENIGAVGRMGRYGQRITEQHTETQDVTIVFGIDKPKTDLSGRREVFDKVIKWAEGCGWLTVNYMSGRRIWIDKAILPSAGDLREWTNDFTLIFRAYCMPYWQDAEDTTSSNGSISVPGTKETAMEAEITNVGLFTIDEMDVQAGDSHFYFDGLGLEPAEKLEIKHDSEGRLTIQIYDGTNRRSAYAKRTAESDDELWVKPGTRSISVSSENTSHTFSVKGRWT